MLRFYKLKSIYLCVPCEVFKSIALCKRTYTVRGVYWTILATVTSRVDYLSKLKQCTSLGRRGDARAPLGPRTRTYLAPITVSRLSFKEAHPTFTLVRGFAAIPVFTCQSGFKQMFSFAIKYVSECEVPKVAIKYNESLVIEHNSSAPSRGVNALRNSLLFSSLYTNNLLAEVCAQGSISLHTRVSHTQNSNPPVRT